MVSHTVITFYVTRTGPVKSSYPGQRTGTFNTAAIQVSAQEHLILTLVLYY